MAEIIIEKNFGIDDADVKVTLTGDAAAVVRAMSALAGASQTRVTEALIRAALKSGVVITGENKVTFPAGATIDDLKEKSSLLFDSKNGADSTALDLDGKTAIEQPHLQENTAENAAIKSALANAALTKAVEKALEQNGRSYEAPKVDRQRQRL